MALHMQDTVVVDRITLRMKEMDIYIVVLLAVQICFNLMNQLQFPAFKSFSHIYANNIILSVCTLSGKSIYALVL